MKHNNINRSIDFAALKPFANVFAQSLSCLAGGYTMNRGGVIEKILLAIFVAAVFLAQANPLLSLAPPEEAIISSAGQSPPAEGDLTLTTAAEIALRHNPLVQATSSAGQM